ncbi:adhesion G protein-coupled receptor E1-like isoform X2 [Megalobrama amblycephala]|uniref:adhesion G protein-coupled receptor E1-like isoform X2 n=1 Tax=Megalobrama amblycephala TaxID=75352 RepID=UPI002013CEF0|nr:adhesion G protein-coupled receptor E1-like isoform X2 [Megalobrama amblycephala]
MSNGCFCVGDKDTCTCSSSTLSSCFCETYNNSITIPTAVSPLRLSQCVFSNDTYICTGAQYRMHCNTRMHEFNYLYQNQNQYQYECWSNNCNCVGKNETCTCYSSTLSSCFCETYGNIVALNRAVAPAYGCVLYNDTYICTGARYHMYCNTRMHSFSYRKNQYQDQYQCSNNCYCVGKNDTCTCSSSTLSSCFCETYGNIVALNREVAPAYGCVLYNDTYICTGAQYHMYCNTRMHRFSYRKNQYQDHYLCISTGCICVGHKDTCTCYSSTLSSCFCETYNNSITVPTAVSPLRLSQCVFFNDTYICTGAQYRMHCNTGMHDFYYQKYQNQNQYEYQCWSNNCACTGNNDTCTCYSSTGSSCFCEYNISSPSLDNMQDQCRSQTSGGCFQNLIDQIENITNQELPLDTVTRILTMAINTSEKILESSSSVSPAELASYGNRVLKASEKLISTLVKPTDTSDSVSFTLPTIEGQVFMVGPNVTLDKIPRLDMTSSSVDIDLIGIAKNNNKGSAAVAFLSYNTMEHLLKPDFFSTSNDTVKTMMSTVISVTLPKTTNTKLTKPVNFTLKHIRDSNPSGSLSCVYWNTSEWIVDGCSVLETNSSYTVCSCVHLSTFTLVQTSSSSQSNPPLDLLTWVSVILGLLFLSVGLLIFALCRWTRMSDWICGHSRCVRLVPEGYVRELSGSSTRSASDVFDVDSKPSTSKVSQEKHCNIMLSLEHVNQNTNTSA